MVKRLFVLVVLFGGCGDDGETPEQKCRVVYDRICAVRSDCLETGVTGYRECMREADEETCPRAVSVGKGGQYERCLAQLDDFQCVEGFALTSLSSCENVVLVK